MKTRLIILLVVGVIGAIANPVSKQTIPNDYKNPSQSEHIESQTKHEESTFNNGGQKNAETIDIIELDDSTDSKDTNCDDKVDIIIEESVVSQVDDAPNFIEGVPISPDQPSSALNPIDLLPPAPIQIDLPSPVQSPMDLLSPEPNPIDLLSPEPSPIDLLAPEPNPIDLLSPEPNLINFSPEQSTIDILPLPQSPIDLLPQEPIPDGFEDNFSINEIPFREAPINKIQDEIMETAAGFVPTPLVFRRKNKPRRRFASRRHFRPNPFRRKLHFFYPYYGFYRPSSLRFY